MTRALPALLSWSSLNAAAGSVIRLAPHVSVKPKPKQRASPCMLNFTNALQQEREKSVVRRDLAYQRWLDEGDSFTRASSAKGIEPSSFSIIQ